MREEYKQSASAHGWWQYADATRERLTEIQLFFYEDRLSGSGIDSRGVFALHGTWLEDGRLTIRKHYGPIPGADLYGDYDGEGTMSGNWMSNGDAGTWVITITGPLQPHNDQAVEIALERQKEHVRKRSLWRRFQNLIKW